MTGFTLSVQYTDMSTRAEIPLTDDELRSLHRETLKQCLPSLLTTMHCASLDLLPPAVAKRVVPLEKDPRYTPVRIGTRLALALNLDVSDTELVALSFGTRVHRIAIERLKPRLLFRATSPGSSTRPEFDATSNRLIALGERLATVFTLPNLIPDAARHTLFVAMQDLASAKETA